MDWTQVLTILGANMAMFLWSVRQSRTDFLHVIRVIDAIKDDMRDFHTQLALQDKEFKMRLADIEERNKSK
jgi:hypothetical protein